MTSAGFGVLVTFCSWLTSGTVKPADTVRSCLIGVSQPEAQHIAGFVINSLIVQYIIREAIRNNQEELVSMRGSLSEVGGARDHMEVTRLAILSHCLNVLF